MKLNAFISLFILVLSSTFISVSANDWQDIKWLDYEDARSLKQSKPIFVFAELHFCSACKKMKQEVFNQAEIIESLNSDFVPVNMKSLGILPNKLPDLKDNNGDTVTLLGSPALVIVLGEQYKVVYGFKNQQQLSRLLKQSLLEIKQSQS